MSTAHIRHLRVLLGDDLVGQLVSSARGELFFQYDPAWLAHPLRRDVLAVAQNAGVDDAPEIIEQVVQAAGEWTRLAAEHGIAEEEAGEIGAAIEAMRVRIG